MGGPLILANSPAWQVAIDGRLGIFDRAQWEEYYATALGKVTIRELVRRHRPDAFFLRRGFHGPLIESLQQARQWREFYSDKLCIIFIKCIEPPVQTKDTPPGAVAVHTPKVDVQYTSSAHETR